MKLLRELLNEGRLDVPTKTPEQLAKKHKVSVAAIEAALKQGIKIEHEHTSDYATAREIALDHLGEDPKYYEKLKKVEEATSPKKKKPVDWTVPEETKKAEKRKEARAKRWAKTGVSPETIKWMRDEGML